MGSRSRIPVSPGDTDATLTPSAVPLREKSSAVNVPLGSPATDGFVTVTCFYCLYFASVFVFKHLRRVTDKSSCSLVVEVIF